MTDLHIPVEKVAPMEPPGTVLLGALDKRAYLYLSMDAKRMQAERATAREHGIQDPIDFLFEFEGLRFKIKYDDLLAALVSWDGTLDAPPCQPPEAWRQRAEAFAARYPNDQCEAAKLIRDALAPAPSQGSAAAPAPAGSAETSR